MQEKSRSLRETAERRDRQRRLLIITAAALVCIVLVVAVAVAIASQPDDPGEAGTSDGGTAFIDTATSVPVAVLDAAGAPESQGLRAMQAIPDGEPLVTDGKPTVIYVGAEFCPYCASERWALISALSRFGTWSGLEPARSGATDGDIPTVSFTNAEFDSDQVVFRGFETADRDGNPLSAPPEDVSQLMATHNPGQNGQGSPIPWTYFGVMQIIGSPVPLEPFLDGSTTATSLTHQEVADAMATGSGELGTSINAETNALTAQICELTDNQPVDVCSAAGVAAAAAVLPG
ncbi:MAG: DUF929 family protein [Actinomycetales bacterium]